jgi:alpha-beta hydrolase superfamily lysophospholipase
MAMKLGQKLAIRTMGLTINGIGIFSKKRAAQKTFHIFCKPRRKSMLSIPSIFSRAEKLSVSVKGCAVNGFRWNTGAPKKLLILHGFESASKNFEAYIQPFIDKNYEVMAFDAPAHGVSEGSQITLPLFIETIRTIDLQFGPIQGFMAHSFGGLALVHYVETIPHHEQIKMALIAPATETKTAIDNFFEILRLGEGIKKEFNKMIEAISGKPAEYFSIPRALQQIKARILWVQDRDDDITPMKDMEHLMDNHNANLQFLITTGLGHRKVYRNGKVINAIVDFL